MGHDLRRWLADCLPQDISTGERLVALEVADWAWDETRLAFGKDMLSTLVRRCGLSDSKQLGKILAKLGARGIELRVPVRKPDGTPVADKLGRILFACKGHELTLRIPELKDCPALKLPPPEELKISQSSTARGTFKSAEGPPVGAQSSPARGTKVPPAGDPIPQESLTTSSSLAGVGGDAGYRGPEEEREIDTTPTAPQPKGAAGSDAGSPKLTAAQAAVRSSGEVPPAHEAAFIRWVEAKHQPRSPSAWWRTVAKDVPELAELWRAAGGGRPSVEHSSNPRPWEALDPESIPPPDDDPVALAVRFLRDLPDPWTPGRVATSIVATKLADNAHARGWELGGELAAYLTGGEAPEGGTEALLRHRIGELPPYPGQRLEAA